MTEKKTTKKTTGEAPKKRAPRAKKAEENAVVQAEAKHVEIKHAEVKPVHKKESKPKLLPKTEVFQGTGRRKTSTAHVYLFRGTGKITVNEKPYEEYFTHRQVALNTILRPFKEMNVIGIYDVTSEVFGGGVWAQADALRMGIARALVNLDPKNRILLRSLDLLRRDPRAKERKKYGLKRARRAFQYSKR